MSGNLLDEKANRWRTSAIPLALILGLAGWVRLHDLGRLSLWLDEGITTLKMTFSVGELFRYTVVDNVPPLYYIILHALGSWVHSDFSLRLPSALLGVATILVLFHISQLLFNQRTALLASLFLSLSTFHVWFSQEARSYGLYCFLYALSLLFLIKWNLSPGFGLNWWLYVVATCLMLYCHSTALIYIGTNAPIFFLLSGWKDWRKIRQWLLAQVLAGVLFLPWVSFFYEQSQDYRQSVVLGPLDVSIVIETLIVLTAMAPLWANEAAGIIGSAKALPAILNLSWFIGFCGPLAWLLISWRGSLVKSYLVALAIVVLPLTGVALFSSWFVNIYFDRLFLPSTLGIALLLAASMEDLFDVFPSLSAKALVALGFAIVALAQLIFSLSIYYRVERKEDFRSATQFLTDHCKERDLAVFVTYSGEALFNWYKPPDLINLRHTGIPRSFLNPPNQSPGHIIRNREDIAALPGLAGTAERIWLVRLRTQYHDPDELTFKWLDQHCRRAEARQFHGVSVDLFSGCHL